MCDWETLIAGCHTATAQPTVCKFIKMKQNQQFNLSFKIILILILIHRCLYHHSRYSHSASLFLSRGQGRAYS